MQTAHGAADVVVDRAQHQVVVEHLHAGVAAVGDVDVALRVDRDRVRRAELARLGAARADRLDEPAVLVVLDDARVDVAVGDEDVALRIPGDVGRPAEVYGCARRRRAGAGVGASPSTASGRRPSTISDAALRD